MSSSTSISVTDTAKLIRKALKAKFPSQKFSVRSSSYADGASIDVNWTDGPLAKDVDSVVKLFAGARFDGMVDLKYWLLPDGTVQLAHSEGTENSKGTVPKHDHPKPHPDAQLVSFGADFVFTHRRHSAAAYRQALQALAVFYNKPELTALEVKDEHYPYVAGANTIRVDEDGGVNGVDLNTAMHRWFCGTLKRKGK